MNQAQALSQQHKLSDKHLKQQVELKGIRTERQKT